jgi:hypothetical protein
MSPYADRFSLTRRESLFLVKKKWDENIHCGMNMENRAVSFPETQTILQGINVGQVSLDDIQAILNMRDAWKHLLTVLEAPLNLELLCTINAFVSRNESLEWGVLRAGAVGIAGTDYRPPLPQWDKAAAELEGIVASEKGETERALDLFLWGTRRQLFWDGNKRTSLLGANKILLASGAGMLTIKEKDMPEFNRLLTAYYQSGEERPLKDFLYSLAIAGIEFL